MPPWGTWDIRVAPASSGTAVGGHLDRKLLGTGATLPLCDGASVDDCLPIEKTSDAALDRGADQLDVLPIG